MSRKRIPACIAALLALTGISRGAGEQVAGEDARCGIWNRQTPTNGFCGLNDSLGDTGIELGLGATSIYQQNVRGGISRHRRAGRFSGSYDLVGGADLQKLLGFEGARVFLHGEGWWSKSGGIDGPSVGSAFGVNSDARETGFNTALHDEDYFFYIFETGVTPKLH